MAATTRKRARSAPAAPATPTTTTIVASLAAVAAAASPSSVAVLSTTPDDPVGELLGIALGGGCEVGIALGASDGAYVAPTTVGALVRGLVDASHSRRS